VTLKGQGDGYNTFRAQYLKKQLEMLLATVPN